MDWNKWFKKNNINLNKQNNYPKVIIEGVDCTGKTTIQNVLMEIIGHCFNVHTSAPTKGNSKEYYLGVLNELIKLSSIMNQPIFFDRFHIGEVVYASIYRKETMNEEIEKEMYKLENRLKDLNFKILYVKASPKIVVKRIKQRGDWYINIEDVETLLDLYELKIKKSILPVYTLNTSNDFTEEDIKNILKFIYL